MYAVMNYLLPQNWNLSQLSVSECTYLPQPDNRNTGGVRVWGGLSRCQVLSFSLTPTNIHHISLCNPSESPAWLPPSSLTSPSLPVCLCDSPSFWPEKRRAQGVSAPLTAGKCLRFGLGWVEGCDGEILWGYLVSGMAASFIGLLWGNSNSKLWWFSCFEFVPRDHVFFSLF